MGKCRLSKNIGLPNTPFWVNTRTAYYRLHGHNKNWWEENSAKDRHNYRYSDDELGKIADDIFAKSEQFDELFIYFQNTTNAHSFYNIITLKEKLVVRGFDVKVASQIRQDSLF